ncbi:MAG: DUF4011 domain-containing protein [Chloroflexota bacterium]|nr:DUF4011 domain-containing protein [Chloroflexota bacterium]
MTKPEDAIRDRLENSRRELLDLSLRNPLLNYRTLRARGVEVVGAESRQVFEMLVTDKRALPFAPASQDEVSVVNLWGESEGSVSATQTGRSLQTAETQASLQRRLLNTHRLANRTIEETGVNTLFLGLGMLKWFESDSSQDARWAPLVLVPVQLERTSVRARFRIRYTGDDLGVNLSLLEKVMEDFGLNLPGQDALEPSDNRDVDLEDYFAQVREVLRGSAPDRWGLVPDRIVLGFFSFNKLLMYLDLGAPDAVQNEMIATLFGDHGFQEAPSTIGDDERIDGRIYPSELYHVLDADSSQSLAIHDASQGRNMIIQGPPGTGKSQTITNIISEAVAQGKRVLFVSEKMAALEVVKRRFDNIGLGDMCLELHSHKANKREALDELKRTLENATQPVDALDDEYFNQILRARHLLNSYADEVNLPVGNTGVSPLDAFGELLALNYDKTTNPIPTGRMPRMPHWSGSDYQQKREIVEDLRLQLQSTGVPRHHPFWGSRIQSFFPGARAELRQKLETAITCLARLMASSERLAATTNRSIPDSLSSAHDLMVAAQHVLTAPEATGLNLEVAHWTTKAESVSTLAELGVQWQRMRMERIRSLSQALERLEYTSASLAILMSVDTPSHIAETKNLLAAAKCAVAAPDADWMDLSLSQWESQTEVVAQLLSQGLRWERIRAEYDDLLLPRAWDTDFQDTRAVLDTEGRSIFLNLKRWFSRSYKRAKEHLATVMNGELPGDTDDQVALIDAIHEEQHLRAKINREYTDIVPIVGSHWDGHNTDWESIEPAITWWLDVQTDVKSGRMQRGAMELVRALGVQLSAEAAQPEIESLESAISKYEESAQDFEVMLDAAFRVGQQYPGVTDLPYEQQREALSHLTVEYPYHDGGAEKPTEGIVTETRKRPDEITREIMLLHRVVGPVLGSSWDSLDTDWEGLYPAVKWWLDILTEASEGRLTGSSVNLLRDMIQKPDVNVSLEGWRGQTEELKEASEAYPPSIRELLSALSMDNHPIFGNSAELVALPFIAQKQALEDWAVNFDRIQDLAVFNTRAEIAAKEGLQAILPLATEDPRAVDALTGWFDRSWYECIVETALTERLTLSSFDGRVHSEWIERFKNLDEQSLEYNRIRVSSAHRKKASRLHQLPSRLVRIDAYRGAEKIRARQQQLRILNHEIQKRTRHKSIRRLLKEAGSIIQDLKPVFMMSPLSIANYLERDNVTFDLVVFDEASQVRPVDALGALMRAKKAVVVGDSRQLPPSRFFDRVVQADEDTEDEESVTADLESVLDLFASKGAPARILRWHYRSRHESLVAVSNQEFYDNKLVIFPSPDAGRETTGLRFHHLSDAVYDRGRSQTNRIEAEAVAQAIMEHAINAPELSLGVAAFSQDQAIAIEDQLEMLRLDDDSGEAFFAAHPEEPFFVKNLENVQGDERDVIFISIGYGRDANGQISMNFGPLNNQGGERRLNVLITRAKYRCHVFSNLKAHDIDLSRTSSVGMRALKTYLEYAETGILPADVPYESGFSVDSPFQREVARRLEGQGYVVHQEVASGRNFVDIGIVDPKRRGKYIIGIECDGASYHSSRSARDRDRLREQGLKGRNWKLHRIWSTDWFNHPERELKRAVDAIERARMGG